MARKTSTKWLIGCGIGCGVIILIFAAMGAGSYFLLKKTIRGFEEVDAAQNQIEERFGKSTDFVPAPDGSIAPDRLEAFLEARELSATSRAEMEEALTALAQAEEGRMTPGVFFDAMMAGFDLLPGITSFLRHRNEALLEAGIGSGEYLYIYAVAYYAWLGKSPADGPPFVLTSHDEDEDEDEDDHGRKDVFAIREDRLEETRRALNDLLTVMLRSQLAAAGGEGAGLDSGPWAEALAAEVKEMEADSYRIAWQDGLPPALESSLEPFRERLEESYCEICNPLEVAID